MNNENSNNETQDVGIPAFNPEAFMQSENVVVGNKAVFTPNQEITQPPQEPKHVQPLPTDPPKPELNDDEPKVSYEQDFRTIKKKEPKEEEVSDEQLQSIGKTLGVEINSKEDLEKLRSQLAPKKEINSFTPNYDKLGLTDEELKRVKHSENVLSKINEFSDEDMLKFQLKQVDPEKYADEDELEFQIGNLKDAGLLKMQADSIRKSVIDSAKVQKDTILNSAKEKKDAIRSSELEQLESSIKQYKDGFHGISISPEKALEIYQKVTDDSIFEDIESSQANVAEMAMLWETRDLIYKALDNPSLQPGIRKMFNELSNVQVKTSTGSQVLSNPNKFDPSAFMSSESFKTT